MTADGPVDPPTPARLQPWPEQPIQQVEVPCAECAAKRGDTVTVSTDLFRVLISELRALTGHFESARLQELVANHDRRMPDGSCLVCTLLQLAEHESAPPEPDGWWTCAVGGERKGPDATRNHLPPPHDIDGPVCDWHAAEKRRAIGVPR